MVGPETPLAAGIVDDLNAAGIKAFGPSKAAGAARRLQGFHQGAVHAPINIPTARLWPLHRCRRREGLYPRAGRADRGQGRRAGRRQGRRRRDDDGGGARRRRHDVRRRSWRRRRRSRDRGIHAGRGSLSSSRCATARHALPLATAQDHKRVFDGDKGPNTGGMGAYSPAPVDDATAIYARVMDEIIMPTLRAHEARRARRYKGVLYAGVMVTERGPETGRIQRPLRRSGMPGADAADDVGHRAGAARLRDGQLKNFDPALVSTMPR